MASIQAETSYVKILCTQQWTEINLLISNCNYLL